MSDFASWNGTKVVQGVGMRQVSMFNGLGSAEMEGGSRAFGRLGN
jgi:hypothetical protein